MTWALLFVVGGTAIGLIAGLIMWLVSGPKDGEL